MKKEELFAILIAVIFITESIDKLLMIKNTHHFTSNPFLYKNDFYENNTKCFHCVHVESLNNGSYVSPNMSIRTERECEELGHDYIFNRECKHVPDVFFFSVILYLITFLMAMILRDIKFSKFFPTEVCFLIKKCSNLN